MLFEVGRGFLAAYSASAEHCDFLVHFRIEVVTHVFRKFSEGIRLRIYGVLEGADLNLILITRIKKENLGIC